MIHTEDLYTLQAISKIMNVNFSIVSEVYAATACCESTLHILDVYQKTNISIHCILSVFRPNTVSEISALDFLKLNNKSIFYRLKIKLSNLIYGTLRIFKVSRFCQD